MKRNLSIAVVIVCALFMLTGTGYAGDIVLTSDAHFSEGMLDNAQVSGNSVQLPVVGTALGSWGTVTALPQPLKDHKAEYYKGKIYITGGYTGSAYSKAVYYATVNTNGTLSAWTTEPDSLPEATRDHGMVIVNGRIYVLGGRQGGAPTDAIYYSELDYDMSLRPWVASGVSLPQPLWGHATVAYAGFIYVIGGTNQATEGTAFDSVFYASVKVDGSLGSWQRTTSLPGPRNCAAAVVSNGRLYVIGGYDNSDVNHNTVYYADINSDGSISSWDSTSALPTALNSHSVTLHNGIVTVVGGKVNNSSGTSVDTVYISTIDSIGNLGAWSKTTSYALRVSDAEAFAVPGRVYILGGYRDPGIYYNYVYRADLSTSSDRCLAGTYLSPGIDVGIVTTIDSLSWNATLNGQSIAFRYRTAGADRIWNGWSDTTSSSPITISTTARYVQYQVLFSGDGTATPVLNDVTISVDGVTYVCGAVSGTWTHANSPYVALCNLTLLSGNLTIEPGVTVKFKSGCGMEIGAAELYAVGTPDSVITFTSLSDSSDYWFGIYFNPILTVGSKILPPLCPTAL